MAIKAEVKNNIKFPDVYVTQDDLMHIANQIFIPLLGAGIDYGIDIEGNKFPEPEQSTSERKSRNLKKRIFTKKGDIRASALKQISSTGLKGFAKKVLVDTGKLRRSFKSKESGKNSVVVTLSGDRLDVGGYLQIDGIKTKNGKKFYKFFGITDGMQSDAMEYAKKKVAEACNKFNGG